MYCEHGGDPQGSSCPVVLMNISSLCQERKCGDSGGGGHLGSGGNPLEDYDNVLNFGF